ncbi:glycoside hydrolase family 88 protein [Prevotella sp. 10(H)]|uniref:glycoside hydrolase family 88 protein n=1 Tax=Prevotella sp. 10(H) TaxID=1158294 RepID=UPI0004A6B9A3|nr:glycoside hydrolase family 88 protein [Prevotella sp. 10(H)]
MILVLSLFTIILIFIGFDFVLFFYEWQARIHIGRWNDRLEWQKAIEAKAHKWLRRSPTVKLTDNNYWVLYDVLRGRYRNRTIQSWQAAGLLIAFGKEESAQYANRVIDDDTNDWKVEPAHIDEVLLAYVLKKNGVLSQKAEASILSLLLNLKGKQTTIPYRSTIPNVRFVDTIGMAVPFLFHCGESELAMKQIVEYDKAKLSGTSIPSHAYDIIHNVPLGIYDWARGIGWYILGLVESNTKGLLNNRIISLAEELLPYQKAEGGFGAMFFNKEAVSESSGTALIGLLMINAYRISSDSRFLDAAFRAEKQLMASTRRTGAIDLCQGDTKGIGYYSTTFSVMPFAQGIALKLSKELNAYANR